LEHFLTEHTFQLLETAAYEAAKALLLEFPLIHSIDFELCKPEAPIPFDFENVSVSMQMGWHKVYIALGSNIGKRQGYIEEALYKIDKEEEFRNLRYSTLIETKPYGYVEQENFINGVLEAETFLKPEQLLHKLQEYEAAAHRERKIHWGPRTLDLDILFYDNLVLDSEQLVIPHPDMMNRTFVLEPLNELVPYLRHPINGMTVAEMYMALKGKE
jgi:dihydroneopterin aldolase/2-amino-4-hydroxy-6-hydroxymethyldihydropteridine diphosphokinase